MSLTVKYVIGILVFVGAGLVVYLHLTSSIGGFIVMPSTRVLSSSGEEIDEVSHLESIIRNATNATILQIGSIYPNCKDKKISTGSVLMRNFDNRSQEIWLILQLHPEQTVESGLLNVRVTLNSQKLFSTHYDVCKKFMPALTCPISAHRHVFGLRYPLPKYSVPGKYGIEAWLVDQRDRTFACITAELAL